MGILTLEEFAAYHEVSLSNQYWRHKFEELELVEAGAPDLLTPLLYCPCCPWLLMPDVTAHSVPHDLLMLQ